MIHRALIVVGVVAAVLGFAVGQAEATWSVVGVDTETGEVGVAVASCVGFEVTVVPVLVPGVGAGASQADISAPSGDTMVEALTAGSRAEEVIDVVVADDDAPESRQFGVVVLDDGGAGWSGSDTLDVALDRRSEDGTVAAQGNVLVSEDVVNAAIAAFEATEGALADRLLAGLVAGADQGGDSRCGDQTATAAALLIARPDDQSYAFTDAALLGVDPEAEAVPSVFISILVEKGGERAPDRLAQAWSAADQSAPSVVIRQIDAGAVPAKSSATPAVFVLLGVLVVGGALIVWLVVRSIRRAKSS